MHRSRRSPRLPSNTFPPARRQFLRELGGGALLAGFGGGSLLAGCGGGASVTPPVAEPPPPPPPQNVIAADPSNYLAKLAALKPGDTLLLAAGDYGVDAQGRDTASPPGLPIFGLNGTAEAP